METPREEQLAEELRALRPTPRPQFAAELDERVAAGFPRRSRLRLPALPRFSSLRPPRMLLRAGALALVAIAIATAVISTRDESPSSSGGFLSLVEEPSYSELQSQLEQQAEERDGAGGGSAPENFDGAAPPAGAASQGAAKSGGSASEEASGLESGSGAAPVPGFSSSASGAAGVVGAPLPIPRDRAVERSAELVLVADPADVADDSSEVFEAVAAHNGIVMRSSTREGKAGEAGARFELLIPSAKLGDALAALSEIDHVRSRHEATSDITAPTVSVGELLQESKARIDSLLAQLEAAETESEREAVEAELRQERRHRARLRSQFQQLQRRADLSRVLVRIETGGSESSSGGGTWGVDDALGDAGQILSIAAAVTLLGLAVLGPVALIGSLLWLAQRTWVRRERQRALSSS